MNKELTVINIDWQGPFDHEELEKDLNDEKKDFGIYQIYGSHSSYGSDALLYIGLANKQTFFERLNQEIENLDHWYGRSGGVPQIYVGRLVGKENISIEEWEKQVDDAEKLLIASHAPAYNSSNIRTIGLDNSEKETLILNQGYYHKLLPEVSTLRWLSDYNTEEYKHYRDER